MKLPFTNKTSSIRVMQVFLLARIFSMLKLLFAKFYLTLRVFCLFMLVSMREM